ncbi:hypothetical protein [Nocardia sp. CA-119907]|uniref:hypothetical protein n=1 Tax=Nocardia sp. CA-119907 TaxID=3239973 RepID=UPI003D96C196
MATDCNGRGMAVPITPGQSANSSMLPAVLEQPAVPRLESGPPRRNPDTMIADKAYSAAANRT